LWGNLEEHKSALMKQNSTAARKPSPCPSLASLASDPQPWPKVGEQPNVNSEDENETKVDSRPGGSGREALAELNTHKSVNIETSIPIQPVSNKPFTCCIKEYGARITEDDPSKANAGSGRKWKRMFGLFGTQISGAYLMSESSSQGK
jgi:protection of telomeres protein 1